MSAAAHAYAEAGVPHESAEPDTAAAVAFLQWWRPSGVLTLTAIPPDSSTETRSWQIGAVPTAWHQVAQWIEERQARKNIYFTANECRLVSSKPAKGDIVGIWAAFTDADPDLDTDVPYETRRQRLLDETLPRLTGGELPASVVLDSGHGLQGLWRFAQPMTDTAAFELLNKPFSEAMGSKGIFNVDRLLRVPGTVNLISRAKLAKGYPAAPTFARVIHLSEAVYSPADLRAFAARHQREDQYDFNSAGRQREDRRSNSSRQDHSKERRSADALGRLSESLRKRFAFSLALDEWLTQRWQGDTSRLNDTSRSGIDMSLGAMLKGRGYSYEDMVTILCAFPHGAGAEKQAAGETRYFLRIWARADGHAADPEADAETPGEEAGPGSPPLPLGEWDAGDDTTAPPPRGWLLGNVFCRRFASSLIAAGGVGKTAVRYAQLMSLAIGRPLTGEHVFERCRVLIVSLEDDADELRRRVLAAALHYGVDRDELKGWLFLAAPGAKAGKLMVLDSKGRPIVSELTAAVEATITARKVDLVSLDPFIKSHSVGENDNNATDAVMGLLTDLASKHNLAVDLPHHTSKGAADPGNADRARGASAMKDAARLVYTLTPMTPEEAQAFGLSEADRRHLVRMDSGKVNITPPLDTAKWFRLVGVHLDNSTELYPQGDNVQTVECWVPPDAWADLSHHLLNLILTDIDAGMPDGDRYSDATGATTRAAWRVVVRHAPAKTEAQARTVVRIWVKNRVLVSEPYHSPVNRRELFGLRVDATRRPT